MSAYPVEHVPTREAVLMRLAEQVRVRRDAARAASDKIRRELIIQHELLLMSDGRTEAFDEVLKLIEQERQKARDADETEMLNEARDELGL